MSPTACPRAPFPPYGPVMTEKAITVQQAARPHGFPVTEDFTFVESAIPDPAVGTVLVENLYWSVDPYHREMMDDVPGGFALRTPLEGRTLGRVVAFRTLELTEGEIVFHRQAGARTPWSDPRRSANFPTSTGSP